MKRLTPHLIILSALSLVSVSTGYATPHSHSDSPFMAQPKEITVLVGKKVVTMDPALPEAQAVAIADGKVISVGTMEDLKPWLSKYPHTIDRRFADKVIYPGFVEAHGHPLIGGTTLTRPPLTYLPLPSPYGATFPGVKTQEAALAQLKKYSDEMANPTDLLVSWGYDLSAIGKTLNKEILDTISTTRPIVVWDSSEHNSFANTAALKKFNITGTDAKKVLGAKIAADGTPTGEFYGVLASTFLLSPVMETLLTPEQALQNFQYVSDLSQQNGITTMSELDFGAMNIDNEHKLFAKFSASPVASQRTVLVSNNLLFTEQYGSDAPEKVKELEANSNDMLIFRGVKFFSDDAYLANTMMVQNPAYVDWHEGVIFNKTPQDFAEALWPWWNAGMHIHVHSNGTIGNEYTASALQLLQDRKPRFDHRFTFEHYGLSSSMNVRKIKQLGAVVSVNPSYVYARAHIQKDSLGSDRASVATRLGNLVKEGVVTSMHSDTPVTAPLPLHHVWFAVTRSELYTGKTEAPAEKITPYQAMRMVTIDAAYTLGVEDRVGSIEPGKYADFTILAEDPQTVAAQHIKDIKVIATVLGGKSTLTSETKKRRPLF